MSYEKDIFDYLNSVGTIIIAISTVVYVITTICIYKYSKKTLNEQLRPYMVIDFVNENNYIYFRIRNTGKREAKEVDIDINPNIDDALMGTDDRKIIWFDIKPILKHSSFTPDYEIKFFMNFGQRILELKGDKRYNYTVNVNYQDIQKNRFKDKFILDLDRIIYKDQAINFNDTYYLSEIDKKIEKLTEILNNKLK